MMTVKQLKTKTRLLVFFFVTVAVPSLFLAYLSLRGIQSERAAAERDLLEQHEGIAQSIVNVIEQELQRIEQTADDLLNRQRRQDPSDLRSMAERIKLSSPLVGEPFFVSKTQFVFPLATRLFRRENDAQMIPTSLSMTESNEEYLQAIQREFQARDFEGASAAYAEALKKATAPQDRVTVLFAHARALSRSQKTNEAASVYGEIARRYKGLSIAGGIPVDLAARLELLKGLRFEGESSQAADEIVKMYEDLLDGTWSLARVQCEFILSSLKTAWSRLSAPPATLPSIYEERIRKAEERLQGAFESSEELMALEARVLTDLLSVILTRHDGTSSSRRWKTTVNSRNVSVIAVPSKGANAEEISMVGVLLKADQDSSGLLSLLEKLVLPPNTLVQVGNERDDRAVGSLLPETARKTIQVEFPGGVPAWTITLYHRDAAFFDQLLTSRRRVYVLAFVLAVGVVVFGSILMWRMIAREVELAKLQADFVSTVSHELRSPLTSIRQLSEMLQRGRIPSEERRQRYYDTMVEQSERLSLLVENILDFARFEEGRKVFHVEEADINSFVSEVVDRMQHQIQHEGYRISLVTAEALPPARIDRDALAQALVNLLDNAIKFSGSSKEVRVEVLYDDGCVAIKVIDRGIGIRQDEIKKIFDRFYRGPNEDVLATRGTGLGLTIVKYVVEGHGGTIAVQSELGNGSTFTIKLPTTGTEDYAHGTNSHH